jgi:ubiquinone/menaquinone biosynthesis C-methylase UbiE
MNKSPEDIVSHFYNTVGWKLTDDLTEDAIRFEDLRDCAKNYVSKCRTRVFKHIPSKGKFILDMASGPIQYKEYLNYSINFEKRYCVDLSTDALVMAEKKIGDHGVYINKSFFDINFQENFFDCAISMHTIYHMDKNLQEEAVRKLLFVTKKNMPVIIVYSNKNTILSKIKRPIIKIRDKFINKKYTNTSAELYFEPYDFSWWKQFEDVAEISFFPWRSFNSSDQKILFPNNKIGSWMFDFLYKFEELFPNIFSKYFQYPLIVLKKKY